MNSYIPSLIHNRIERETQPELPEIVHPSVAANEKAQQRQKELRERIRLNCQKLKALSPETWKALHQDLYGIYDSVKEMDRRNVVDFMNSRLDPSYYGLCKAHTSAQAEILESIFGALELTPTGIPVTPSKGSEAAPKTFFRNLLDLFKRM